MPRQPAWAVRYLKLEQEADDSLQHAEDCRIAAWRILEEQSAAGFSQRKIADAIGKTQMEVSRRLRALKLIDEGQAKDSQQAYRMAHGRPAETEHGGIRPGGFGSETQLSSTGFQKSDPWQLPEGSDPAGDPIPDGISHAVPPTRKAISNEPSLLSSVIQQLETLRSTVAGLQRMSSEFNRLSPKERPKAAQSLRDTAQVLLDVAKEIESK